MKEDDSYCGFVCGDIIARQQDILDEIKEFSKVNPEYALVMIGKIMEMVYYGKDKLINGPDSDKTVRVNDSITYAECQRCSAPGEIHLNHLYGPCGTCGKHCY